MYLKVKYVICFVLLLMGGSVLGAKKIPPGRDKRTIDQVLRSVADAFGYDVLKRPPVIPPAPTTPAPKVSTFFPPPVAPLTFAPPKAPQPPPAAPPPAPKAPPLPILPPLPVLPPLHIIPPQVPRAPRPLLPRIPLPLPLPRVPYIPPRALPPLLPPAPPPKAPVPPPKAPPPPIAPAPPPPAAPPKPPVPVLTETVRKSFNLNFNWNKNIQPGAASPPAQGAPPSGAPPAKPAPAPAAPPSVPVASAPVPPAPPAPAAAIPLPLPIPGGQHFLKKPQLYREDDYVNNDDSRQNVANYEDEEENDPSLRGKFEKKLEGQQNYDYPDYQNQQMSPDYSENSKNAVKPPKENEHTHSKERFKESVDQFWQNFPLTDQHGYKYIAPPEKNQQQHQQFSVDYPETSKYEEYELVPQQDRRNLNQIQQHPQNPIETAEYHNQVENIEVSPNSLKATPNPDYEEQAYVYLNPKDYADYSEEPQPRNQQEDNANSPQRFYIRLPEEKAEVVTQRPYRSHESIRNYPKEVRKNNNSKFNLDAVVQPASSGSLPVHLHHLVRSESQAKPWSVPYYDYDIEGTEHRNKYIKKNDTKSRKSEHQNSDYNCCQKASNSGNFDFYTVPEPQPMDYAQFEKLHVDEDDKGFSKNAKFQTKEKKVSIVKTDQYETPLKW